MPEPEAVRKLLVVTTTVTDETATVAAVGEVDLATVSQLHDAVAQAVDTYQRTVVDLTATSYLSSSGIQVLLEFAEHLSEIIVDGQNGLVFRVLELTHLDQVVTVRAV
jgi:anti-anti-sigma factor